MPGVVSPSATPDAPPLPPPRKSKWTKFFRVGIQDKLILAFIAMGLVPMMTSHYVAGQIESNSIERDMRRWLDGAAVRIEQNIMSSENTARRCCEALSKRQDLLEALRADRTEDVERICEEERSTFGLDYVHCAPPLSPEERVQLKQSSSLLEPVETIMVLEGWSDAVKTDQNALPPGREDKSLMAGCRLDLVDNGAVMAELMAGDYVGDRFGQEVSQVTGVQVIPFLLGPTDGSHVPDIRGVEAPADLWRGLYRSDRPVYADVKFNGNPYLALFLPLQGRSGKTLGIVFMGHLRSFTFVNILASKDFFFLSLCLNLIVATLMGITIARGISKPIRKLARGVQDVTEGKLDQMVVVRTRDELQDLAVSLNTMRERLKTMRQLEEQLRVQDRLAALGELAAGVAHEIRNPLGIIRGSAEVLQRRIPVEDPKRELVDFIKSEVDRLNNVVSDFLAFARPTRPTLIVSDVNAVVDKTVGLLAPTFKERGVELVSQYDSASPTAPLDPEKMHQVFLNILLNAADAMEEGGQIRVQTRLMPMTQDVRIIFQDTGEGIPEDDLERIFNPFFTTKPAGTGLGLAIVQRILEGHSARIEVSSVRGRGTCFVLVLKAASSDKPSTVETGDRENSLSRT